MRCTRREQLRMGAPDPLGLDLRHRELVDAAGMTAPATLEAVGVDGREGAGLAVDLVVEGDEVAQSSSAPLCTGSVAGDPVGTHLDGPPDAALRRGEPARYRRSWPRSPTCRSRRCFTRARSR